MLSRTSLLALLLVAFGAVACEPPALDPDHASGSSADSTGSKSSKKKKSTSKDTATDDDDDTTADDTGSTTKPSKQTTNTGTGSTTTAPTTGGSGPPASFSAVYSGLKTSCGSCHLSGAAGAPTFFGDTEATTYDDFVNQNFNSSPSPLVTKGQHSGPALTSAQQSAVEAWVAADPAQ